MGANLNPGTKIGSYFVEDLLGEGGVGKVYLAKDAQDRKVALKVLEAALSPQALRYFKQEVRLLAHLNHPYLVKIYDFHEADFSKPFFAMEYIEGSPLDKVANSLSPETWVDLFFQTCSGLDYLHAQNVLHRDLKPSNLILSSEGQIKILDFSLSSLEGPSGFSGAVGGTLPFLPPEAFQGLFDKRSDLFSLGVVFYYLLSGLFPFDRPLQAQNLSSLAKPSLLGTLRRDLPAYFSDLIDRLLEWHPDRRPSSTRVLLRYLSQHRSPQAGNLTKEIPEFLEKPPWVGRIQEWQEMENWFREQGDPSRLKCFVIKGPTGVGRSRLLEELRWKILLESKIFLPVLPPKGPWMQDLLHRLGENASSQDFFTGARLMIQAAQRRPLILAFQDLQNWDPQDRSELGVLLKLLQRGSAPIRIILEFNEDFLKQDELFGSQFHLPLETPSLHLKDLSPKETRELITKSILGPPLPEDQVEKILKDSGGRPLLVLEILQEVLALDSSAGGRKNKLPRNLQEAVQLKVAGLSPEAVNLVGLIVVRVEPPMQEDLGELWQDKKSIEEAMLELGKAGIIQWSNQGMISLQHPGLKETFKKALTKDIRIKSHECWIELLQKRLSVNPSDHASLLGLLDHAIQTEDRDLLTSHGLEGVSLLHMMGQYGKALEWSKFLLALSSDSIPLSRIYSAQAPLYIRLADYPKALEAYQNWYQNREDDATRLQAVKFFFYQGLVYYHWKKQEAAVEKLKQCLATGDSRSHSTLRPYHARALILLAALSDQERQTLVAKSYLEQAIAVDLQDPQLLGEIHQRLGELALKTLSFPKAEAELERSLAYYEKTQNPQMIALALNAQSILYKEWGQYRKALEKSKAAVEAALQSGEKLTRARYLGNQGLIHSELGEYRAALDALGRSLEIVEILGSLQEKWVSQLQIAQVYLYVGNWERTEPYFASWMKEKSKLEELGLWTAVLLLKAELLYLAGDFSKAKSLFEQVLKDFSATQALLVLPAHWGWVKAYYHDHIELPGEESEQLVLEGHSSSSLLHQAWAEIILFVKKNPAYHSRQSLEAMVRRFLILEGPEQQMDLLELLELYLLHTGLSTLSSALRGQREEIWNRIFSSLPEELKMDYEKNRGLFDVEEALKTPMRKPVSDSAPSAPSNPAPALPTERPKISEERFRQFCEITRQISQKTDLQEILEQVMDASILLTGAERGFLILKNEKMMEGAFPGFEVKTARHINSQALSEEDFQLSLSLVKKAISQGAPIFSENALEDSRFQEMKSIHLYQLKSVMVVPLEISGKIIGVLYLDHRYRPNCFSQEDIAVLSGFAGQAGLAIQKVQMMQALKRSHETLEIQVKDQAQRLVVLSEELSQVRQNLKYEYKEIIGNSPAMMRVFKLLDHVTKTRIPVWIWGESGTGKELIAYSLHHNSPRKDAPFVTENCSSIPENLLESELFGHKKGSFTHADRDRVGLFEQADGGTLFLDEVADMPLSMQAKLLRVLQEGEVRPVGSNKKVKIDVRLVTASNRDLTQMVKDGKFREDLFYRINGLTLRLPALKERKEDLPSLVHHLVKKIASENDLKPSKVTKEALQYLLKQDFPGNIRQLEGMLRNAMMFADGEPLTHELLTMQERLIEAPSKEFTPSYHEESFSAVPETLSDEDSEKAKLVQALRRHHLDKNKVARELGITLKSVYVRMQRLGIPKKNSLLIKFLDENS